MKVITIQFFKSGVSGFIAGIIFGLLFGWFVNWMFNPKALSVAWFGGGLSPGEYDRYKMVMAFSVLLSSHVGLLLGCFFSYLNSKTNRQ